MQIVLLKGKFISNGKMYAAGDILPDTPGARALVEMGRAVAEGSALEPPRPPAPTHAGTDAAKGRRGKKGPESEIEEDEPSGDGGAP